MKKAYFEVYTLLDQLSNPLPRLNRIHKIVKQPDFQYKKGEGADFILSMFLRSSYWLDRELFDESYLYQGKKQKLSTIQNIHLKMVEIGAVLLDKGFPLKYNPSEYVILGPHQLGTYVKIFTEQCHKKYNSLHKKVAHQKVDLVPRNRQRMME